MKPKDYQNQVLEDLSGYLRELAAQREVVDEVVQIMRERGMTFTPDDYCKKTWDALHARRALPRIVEKGGAETLPPYVPRVDGLGRPIPNICFKIPTGGGKTYLATGAIEKINIEYFKRQTGFVLWIVPSDAIYQQTWKSLANREHPYRQMLERASAGRVKLLEKDDSFTRQDVENYLCVMLFMLQAGAVKRESKEGRKVHRDTGRYPSFFPEVDDAPANKALQEAVPNLDTNDDEALQLGTFCVKQSLENTFRLVRPIVVVDEGHKAYSDTALQTIASYNPRFILELSATPNAKENISNIVVNVTGTALRKEDMIKQSIVVINDDRADWKHALASAKDQLDKLKRDARKVQNNEDKYIRPILLVRAERMGEKQLDKAFVHGEHVREYLIKKLGVKPEQVKVQSSELKELDKIDLMSETCDVRYIITKDALREGWDCPFAYVLAVLSNTRATVALTQMVGRILRQPYAKRTSVDSMNECYVFTYNQDVGDAIQGVRDGLTSEGMGDLASAVRAGGSGAASERQRETIRRREKFRGLRVFLPRVLAKHYKTGAWRPFDYERDLLRRIEWDGIGYTKRKKFKPDDQERVERSMTRFSVEVLDSDAEDALQTIVSKEEVEGEIDFSALVRMLLDVVPNPWQGARILNETLATFRRRKDYNPKALYTNRLYLVKDMKDDLKRQVEEAGEAEFRKMLAQGELRFTLESSNDPKLNWELAETFEVDVSDDDRELKRKSGLPLERSLFHPVYQKQFNSLERDVALYLDADAAVYWWHRIAVHNDWYLQGWHKSKVYPDILACLVDRGDGLVRFTVLETKGGHLKGNDDTEYKRRLFDLLTEHSQTAEPVGELLLDTVSQKMRFELMLENDWRTALRASLQ